MTSMYVDPDGAPIELLPETWCTVYDVQVLDPDGWRGANHKPWSAPITLEEFVERFNESTARGHDKLPEVREKNKPLDSRRSTIHNQGAIMADQTPAPATETPQVKVKVPLKTRIRNFNTKHPRLPKIVALVAAVFAGAVGHKVMSERRVVHKETLAALESDAEAYLDTTDAPSRTEA